MPVRHRFWILVAVGLAIALPVVAAVWRVVRASRAVEAELARIRAAGEPTSPGDLDRLYRSPPRDRDATPLWLAAAYALHGPVFRQAAAKVPIVGPVKQRIPPPGQPWPGLTAAEKLLDQFAEPLERLHRAARLGGAARFPVDFAAGPTLSLDHATGLRYATRLLALEAHVRAHEGDTAGAAQAIHAMLMLVRSLEREPVPISQLVRIANCHQALAVLARLLPHVQFTDEQLNRLRTDVRATDFDAGLRLALLGARVFGLLAFDDPAGPARWPLLRSLVLGDAARTIYLDYMRRLIAAAEKPWPQRLRAVGQIERQCRAAAASSSALGRGQYLLTCNVISAFKHAFQSHARGTAMVRSAEAALGVELYRRRHGRLPARLAELGPELLKDLPVDPFDGQPLRYRVRDADWVVYSVGKDGVDGGGPTEQSDQADFGFRVPR